MFSHPNLYNHVKVKHKIICFKRRKSVSYKVMFLGNWQSTLYRISHETYPIPEQ